jgi:hypothetical protein
VRTVNADDDYIDFISDDLDCKGIENYNMVMDSHVNYLTIFNNQASAYKYILKKFFSLNKNR